MGSWTRKAAGGGWRAALLAMAVGLGCNGADNGAVERADDAEQLSLSLTGSLQNPAWSPAGDAILLTRFREGYNQEPADLYVMDVADLSVRALVSDGSGNVSLPGSAWSETLGQIIFSSSRDPHDEIFVIDEDGQPGDEVAITSRGVLVAYEPTFSPDGEWALFESHQLDQEDNGVITKFRIDGSGDYLALTDPGEDCRQPNWSGAGGQILYQTFTDGQWDIWVMDEAGGDPHPVTTGPGDKTDASFSPDGEWIVYSSNEGDQELANIYVIPVAGGDSIQVTDWDGYDGAPSWSADGERIAFESFPDDPDDSAGTSLWWIEAPTL